MQIVSDRGMDMSPEQLVGLDIHLVPLTIHLDGKSYVSGVDIQPDEFYTLLTSTESMPTTSLPSPGDFVTLYKQLAETDPEILSVHISSGLSGTVNAAREGASLVPEAKVTIIDTFTLSGGEGWQVEAAARAAKAGWPMEKIVSLVARVREVTETIYTLPDLKWLINGGRIGHIKGLLATILKIKPVIGVSKEDGRYYQRGQARTMERALDKIVDIIAESYPAGTEMRLQPLHANNPEGANQIKKLLEERFKCTWLPTGPIAPVLGAHTGPGLVGVIYAPLASFPEIP